MSNKDNYAIRDIADQKLVIDIDLAPNLDKVYSGRCLIANSEIVILLNFNEKTAEFDGFSVLNNKDIEKYRVWGEEDFTQLKNDNTEEQLEKFNFEEFISFKSTFNNLTSELIAVFTYDDEESYYVGKLLTLNENSVELQLISEESEWIGIEVIDLDEISYIGFRTSYKKSLMDNSLQEKPQ